MIKDYILQQDNAVSDEWCDKAIELFNSVQYVNRSEYLGKSPLLQENQLYHMFNDHMLNDRARIKVTMPMLRDFNDAIKISLLQYIDKYPMLNEVGKFQLNLDVQIQRTKPGQGYHEWHCEHDNKNRSERLLLCLIYLNDVAKGGETEFLNQHLRIKPKKGRLVICPAFWTHFHRGNPPISGEKYMINGWMEFADG